MNDFLQSLRNGQADKQQRTPKTRKNYDNSYHHTSSPRYQSYGGGYHNTRPHMKRQPAPPQQSGNQLPMDDNVLLADAIENLTSHIETLVKTQEYMASIQDRTAEMIERQAIAIERIVNHLNISSLSEVDPVPEFENHFISSQEEPAPKREAAPKEQQDVNREAVQDRTEEQAQPVRQPLQSKKETLKKPVTTQTASSPAEKTKPVVRKRKKVEAVKKDTPQTSNTKLMSREAVMDIIYSMRDEGATFDQVAKRLIELEQPTFSGRGEWHAQTVHRLCAKK